jgi:hypothetical protein
LRNLLPVSLTLEVSTVFAVYGLLCDAVAWQMVTFPLGVALTPGARMKIELAATPTTPMALVVHQSVSWFRPRRANVPDDPIPDMKTPYSQLHSTKASAKNRSLWVMTAVTVA